MKRLSWKYVAGLLDGEGCLDFGKHYPKSTLKTGEQKNYSVRISPRVRVTLTTPGFEVIEHLVNNFGGSVENRPGNPDRGWLASQTWVLTGRRVRGLLQNVVNHLLIKKNQAVFLIWFIDHALGKRFPGEQSNALRGLASDEMKLRKQHPHRLSIPAELLAIVQHSEAIVETQPAA